MAGSLSSLSYDKSRPPHLLVCDDSMLNCRLVKSTLGREGCRVDIVTSAEEALDQMQHEGYDLVLMDVEMPGMSGIEFLRVARGRLPERVFLPIVLLTAKTDQESKLDGLHAGATDFITKPFDPPELTARIRNHVASKRIYDDLMVVNEALQEERAKVSAIQRGLLPREMPRVDGFRFGASYLPSSLAGGDYYDVIIRPGGHILLAVGDVSGHGIPSAMHMSILRATLHSAANAGMPVEEIMSKLNDILRHALDDFSFVTFYLAELDPVTGTLSQCAAGHHGPLLLNSGEQGARMLPLDGGLPLGVMDGLDFAVTRNSLRPGDRLLIYTDGLTEEQNRAGEMFELKGLLGAFERAAHLAPEEACAGILGEAMHFAGGTSPRDDVTMLMLDVERLAPGGS